jgi:hypothetical protein
VEPGRRPFVFVLFLASIYVRVSFSLTHANNTAEIEFHLTLRRNISTPAPTQKDPGEILHGTDHPIAMEAEN